MSQIASPEPLTDEQRHEARLLERAIAGDRGALEELLISRHDQLQRHIERKMPRTLQAKVAAEDILQQTYLQAFKAIGRFEPKGPGAFFGWLKTIATRKLIDATRKRDRDKEVQPRGGPTASGSASCYTSLFGLIANSAPGPQSQAMVEDLLAAFHVALANLPDNYRQVVKLRYLDDLPMEEVAERLQIAPGAARGLCHRARKSLRDELLRLSRFI